MTLQTRRESRQATIYRTQARRLKRSIVTHRMTLTNLKTGAVK